MEQSDVVFLVAANARTRCRSTMGSLPETADALVRHICAILDISIAPVPPAGVMLGGAYARLQMWVPGNSQAGGMVWVSQELSPEHAAFAIAHELGHYMLHPGEGRAIHRPCEQSEVSESADPTELRTEGRRVEEYTPRARRELEANAFAAELLAPRAKVRALFTDDASITDIALAAHFGISETLARRRLIDAVLTAWNPADATSLPAEVVDGIPATTLLDRLDDSQRAAACANGPTLVVAGPGTGKTATLVGRVAYLVAGKGEPPERVLALTFSNRAAGEMRDRLISSRLPGERMPVMTIHAFAASLLREYAPRVPRAADERPFTPEFRILDETDAFLLMEELLGELPLRYYRSLGNPTARLRTLLSDFSRARDGLHTPARYLELVEVMPIAPQTEEEAESLHDTVSRSGAKAKMRRATPPGTYTAEEVARARERARSYGVWDAALRTRGVVDFGGLIQRAVELLRADSDVLADVRARYPHILVDEFQDTNAAAAELLVLLAGDHGEGLWVVGDRNQAIYRWRGASPGNVRRLERRYPHLAVHTLRRCYRSVPDIVATGSAMAARMARMGAAAAANDHIGSDEDDSDAHAPVALEPVRQPGEQAAVLRYETFATDVHERRGLAATIRRLHEDGIVYGEQAVLCRTHKQAQRIAKTLANAGLPVSQLGDYFARTEIKEMLALLALASGPDARGLLRAGPLVAALGFAEPPARELANAVRGFKAKGKPLPYALTNKALLADIPELSPETQSGLYAIGKIAQSLRLGNAVLPHLLDFLLRPRGYAWRLARVADGLELPEAGASDARGMARTALAALGELAHLARRFDTRWQREDDFRLRLSRAVFRVRRRKEQDTRHAASPLAPDALEPDAGADVMPLDAADGPSAAPAVVEEEASAVRCFLHYLDALRAAGAEITVPAGNDDAVRVLTLHASKGLEYRVVYLPGLARGQFPASGSGRDDPSPPGFREDDTPAAGEAEERCLFYVGVTRARDTIVLTRAGQYGQRSSGPSPLLDLLEAAEPYRAAPSPLPDDELAALWAKGETLAEAEQDSDGDEGDEDDEEDALAGMAERIPGKKPVFPLRALKQYLECPRQYKYAEIYKLLDPTEDAVFRFHRYVRRGRGALAQMRAANRRATWAEAEERLRDLWTEVGPAGHAYDGYYWLSADQILRDEWRALEDPAAAAAAAGVPAEGSLRAELRCCVVEVRPDRIGTPASDGDAPVVLVRQHTGRERQTDREDLALPLYYIAHQQRQPGVPVRIELAYLSNVLADGEDDADVAFQRTLQDVTEKARTTADLYLQTNRTRRSTLDKLDRAALGILAGRFPPKPADAKCAACPYYYVCPADPDED